MNNINDFIIHPFLSLIITLFLFIGFYFIGKYLFTKINILDYKNNYLFHFQYNLIGIVFVGMIIYPIGLLGYSSLFFFRFISFLIFIIGIFNFKKMLISFKLFYKILKSKIDNNNIQLFNIVLLFIFGYFLFALAPVTDADSLDYHIGYAIQIIKNSGYIFIPEWFSSRLSGNGEILNALGISLSAIQLGSLIQFSAVLGITGILLFTKFNKTNKISKENLFITLLFLSSPILLSLINPKPQLSGVSINSLAFFLYLNLKRREVTNVEKLKIFSFISILLFYATQIKFSFILSSFIILLFSLYEMYKINLLNKAIKLSVIFFILYILPTFIWKLYNYNSNIFDVLFKISPDNLPGIANFNIYLKNFKDNSLIFPSNLILPNNIGTITTIIGVGVIFVLFSISVNLRQHFKLFLIPLIFILLAIILAPKVSRYYLEPFIWLLILFLFYNLKTFQNKYFSIIIYLQFCITSFLIFYGVFSLLPGSFTNFSFEKIMNNKSNGYKALTWYNLNLPKDAIVIYDGRSNALIPRNFIASDWLHFVDSNIQENNIYYNRIKLKSVTHLLLSGKPPHNIGFLSSHIGKKIAGPFVSKISTRNPFNSGVEVENWIYEFKY